jgi:hypothetical protein
MGTSYCCEKCAADDLTRPESGAVTMAYQCAYCEVGGNRGHMQGQTSKARVRAEDVLLIMDINMNMDLNTTFQYMRFCHQCYKIARNYNYLLTKEQLWKQLKQKKSEYIINTGKGIYKK